ncbi:MAG: hypothetical protein ACOX7L_06740 [Dethiobacteria bacterium]
MESLQGLVKASGEKISDEVREKGKEIMGVMGSFVRMLKDTIE